MRRLISPVFIMIHCVLIAPTLNAEPVLSNRIYRLGEQPRRVLQADLDHDGNQDLIVIVRKEFEVAILIGNGDGTFAPKVSLPVAGTDSNDEVTDILLADFNRDGNEDLVVSSIWNISMLFGNGDGTFDQEITLADPEWHANMSLAAGDLNGDHRLDLVVGHVSSTNLSENIKVFLGGGGASGSPFQSPINMGAPSAGYFVEVADFNGDDILDIVSDHFYDMIAFYPGNGDGTFTSYQFFDVGDFPFNAVSTDFNNDDRLDLVVVNPDSDDVSVLLGIETGIFAPQVRYAVGNYPTDVIVADLDGDDQQDLIVANNWEVSISTLHGNNDGTFDPHVQYLTPYGPAFLTAADFNNNGLVDIGASATWLGAAYVLFGNGDGTLQHQGISRVNTGVTPKSVAIGDLDGDKFNDIAVANAAIDSATLIFGDGKGQFPTTSTILVGDSPTDIAIDYLDYDGNVDLAVVNELSLDLSVLPGTGNGTFPSEIRIPIGASPKVLTTGDVDGDDELDIVVVDDMFEKNILILLGKNDGSFEEENRYEVGNDPVFATLAHLNTDSHLDVVAVNQGSGDISILLGNGTGSFSDAVNYSVLVNPAYVSIGDVNGDGIQDIAVADASYETWPPRNHVSILVGNGDGTFGVEVPIGVLEPADAILVDDYDQDGQMDMAVAVGELGHLFIYLFPGNGDGSFDTPLTFAVGGMSGSEVHRILAKGDLDGNKMVDLVYLSETAEELTVLLNLTPTPINFDSDKITLKWHQIPNATSFNVYRGDLSDLVDFDMDGLPDDGYGSCYNYLDPDTSDNMFIDIEIPATNSGFFYLRSNVINHAEDGLGLTSAGMKRSVSAPCP